jgi:hypothetical protein
LAEADEYSVTFKRDPFLFGIIMSVDTIQERKKVKEVKEVVFGALCGVVFLCF